MTEKKDDYYQPWLRDPAPASASAKPQTNGEGLAKPRETPPTGVDMSRYAADAEPVRDGAAPSDQLKSGAEALWQTLRRGGGGFADWTIRAGARADIPAKVAAMELPRRTRELAARSGAGAARTAQAIGRGSARAASAAAATGGGVWRKMALGEKVAKISSEAGRGLGEVAGKTRAGIGNVAKAGKTGIGEAAIKLRPAPRAEPEPPPSGLDQLIAREEAAAPPPAKRAPDLPLFAADPAMPEAAKAQQGRPAPEVDDRTPHIAETPAAIRTAPAARLPQVKGDVGANSGGGRIWIAGLAAIALLAGAFWLGARFGGGMSRSEVETVVAEYIRANPQIIPEALDAHRAGEIGKAIDAIRPALERPYAGAWAGNGDGDVTVVVFTDYACVFCRASVPDIDRLLREDSRVKLVFRELPIIAPQSRDAALMALAAARQGKYDAFHHAMFAAPSLGKAAIAAAAAKAGVVTDGSADATASEALLQRELESNFAIANQLQLSATPTWIIGDQLLQGQIGYDGLRAAVAKARAKG